MIVPIFLTAWILTLTYVVAGLILYSSRILPALRRAGLDGSPRLGAGQQLAQVDAYVALLAAEPRRPWYFGPLRRARAITVVVVLAQLAALVAIIAGGDG